MGAAPTALAMSVCFWNDGFGCEWQRLGGGGGARFVMLRMMPGVVATAAAKESCPQEDQQRHADDSGQDYK